MGKTLVVLIVRVKKYLNILRIRLEEAEVKYLLEWATGTNQEAQRNQGSAPVSVIAQAARFTCKGDRAGFVFTSGIASLGKSQGWAVGCDLWSPCFVL